MGSTEVELDSYTTKAGLGPESMRTSLQSASAEVVFGLGSVGVILVTQDPRGSIAGLDPGP